MSIDNMIKPSESRKIAECMINKPFILFPIEVQDRFRKKVMDNEVTDFKQFYELFISDSFLGLLKPKNTPKSSR